MSPLSTSHWRDRIEAIGSVSLGKWPTPVEPFEALDVVAKGRAWIKREDLSSRELGGNKVRKLEMLLAKSDGPVITFGALGSGHVLSTAVHAATLQRPCIGILVSQPITPHVERVLALTQGACAHVIRVDRPVDSVIDLARKLSAIAGKDVLRATLISPGGSDPLGTAGFVRAGLELADQIAAGECPLPDRIYVPLGTGGTAVGLALGLALAGVPSRVIAVRVATLLVGNEKYLGILARRTYRLIAGTTSLARMPKINLCVDHQFVGPGYGHPTVAGARALDLASSTGLAFEATYTGKALAAMIADLGEGHEEWTGMFLDTYGPMDHLEIHEQ